MIGRKNTEQSTPVKRENYLVLTAVGKEEEVVLLTLSRLVANHRCTILDCRMSLLGEETATYMLVTGPWDAVSRLEQGVEKIREGAEFAVQVARTPGQPNRPGIPYNVNLVSVDGPGIIHDMLLFFASRGVAVDDLQSNTQTAPQSDTRIFSMNMLVRLPTNTHLPALREEFMVFCDERNLDAVIEPLRAP
ncbi:ACT domain-containing protein [Marinobacteraceae bacterium S3BR75-40.1]